MSLRSFILVVLLVLVAVIVVGCNPIGQSDQVDTPPISDTSNVDAAAGTQADADLFCAIAHTPFSVFFRNLVHMAGIGPVP